MFNKQHIIGVLTQHTGVRPKIVFALDSSLGDRFGDCRLMKDMYLISISTDVVLLADQQIIDEVIVHEIAHAFVHASYGYVADQHGDEWQQLMALCGYASPLARHCINVQGITPYDTSAVVACKHCGMLCGVTFGQKCKLQRGKRISKHCVQCAAQLTM